MTVRFLIDEMFPPSVVPLLVARGHDAIHVVECGLGARPDAEVAAAARAQGRVVVTENVQDFASAGADVAVACVLKSRLRARAIAKELATLLDGWTAGNPDPLPGLYWPT